jgi:hypothetical protein
MLVLNPIIVSPDYEIGMQNAIHALLTKSRIIGCNFHMRQAIFRNVLKSKFVNMTWNIKKIG